jgi:hypothetical protein
MANVLKVNEQITIPQLAAQRCSRRRIARETKIVRKTVRRYLEAGAKSPTISTPGSPERLGIGARLYQFFPALTRYDSLFMGNQAHGVDGALRT